MTESVDFDVVVVGAGPAGLACAFALADLKVLVLDREARHGGRIRTVDLGPQRVDMGACFAFDRAAIPADLAVDTGSLIEERADLAVHDGQRAHASATPLGCLLRMGVDAESLAEISAVARLEAASEPRRPSRAHGLLDALMHQVHPGDWAEYARRHRRDGLLSWYPDHWERGNASLTDALLARSGADLQTGAEATEVVDRGDCVEIGFTRAGEARRVRARTAVIATPADVAARLVDWTEPRLRRLLGATHYAGYLVVALAGRAAPSLGSFRSLVPLAGAPALVVQQRTADRAHAVLLCYLRGSGMPALAAMSDRELAAQCQSWLAALGIDPSALNQLTESAVQRWPHGGTILSDEYLEARAAAGSLCDGSIVVAGDYACQADGAGYGVADALRSGLRAAADVRACTAGRGAGRSTRES